MEILAAIHRMDTNFWASLESMSSRVVKLSMFFHKAPRVETQREQDPTEQRFRIDLKRQSPL